MPDIIIKQWTQYLSVRNNYHAFNARDIKYW